MPPFKREDWNDIIRTVNSLATTPDDGCDPLATLPEVGPDHIWTFGDITAVQAKLVEICNENIFSSTPQLWKNSIITEISTAIGRGWCNCTPETECIVCPWPTLPLWGDPGVPVLRLATTNDANPHSCAGGYCHFADKINGLNVGPANHSGVIAVIKGFYEDLGPYPSSYHFSLGAFSCTSAGNIVVPPYVLSVAPPTTCSTRSNLGWVVATHNVTVGYPPVTYQIKYSIDIYLQCSTICTPPGMPIGTPSLLKQNP